MQTQWWAMAAMAACSVLAALGTFFVKLAAPKLKFRLKSIISNRKLIGGLFIYGFSVLLSLVAYRGGELSILYPIVALQYVWTGLLSKKYLGERITLLRWAGVALIFIGVALIGIGA